MLQSLTEPCQYSVHHKSTRQVVWTFPDSRLRSRRERKGTGGITVAQDSGETGLAEGWQRWSETHSATDVWCLNGDHPFWALFYQRCLSVLDVGVSGVFHWQCDSQADYGCLVWVSDDAEQQWTYRSCSCICCKTVLFGLNGKLRYSHISVALVAPVCNGESFCWPGFAFFLHPFSLPLEELIAWRHAIAV